MAVSPPEVVLIGAAILDALAPGADARVFETGSLPCPGLRLQTGGDAMNEAVVQMCIRDSPIPFHRQNAYHARSKRTPPGRGRTPNAVSTRPEASSPPAGPS